MSDNETTTTKTRGKRTHVYTDLKTNTAVVRVGGAETIVAFNNVDEGVWNALALECCARLLTAGRSYNDIVSGEAIPDRTLPVGPKQRQPRKPNAWVQAVANVKARDMNNAAKAGGDKPDKAAIAAMHESALAWARSLTPEQLKKLRTNRDVIIAHAQLSGDTTPLEALLAVPAADAEMQEAAD
jgi:hypothetical protein